MASSNGLFRMGLMLALMGLTAFGPGAMAQPGCTNVLIGMASCLNYVTGSSSSPSSSCCSQLAKVVKSQPQCLCTALNGGGSALGMNINQTLALALPGACNIKTPSISRCNAANGPSPSPSPSPMGSQEDMPAETPNSTPDSKPSHAFSGSKTVPSDSYASATKIPLALIMIMMIGSFISTRGNF